MKNDILDASSTNAIQIKVYKVDYSFIIKNYLDKSLWNKEWTLFEYKDFRVSIKLHAIYTQDEELTFEITAYKRDNDSLDSDSTYIWHNLRNSNLKVLKKQIDSAIIDTLSRIERRDLRSSSEYKTFCDIQAEEDDRLEDIAKNFLDDNGITIDSVRDAYIEKFVDDNSASERLKSQYLDECQYTLYYDMFIVLGNLLDHQYIINKAMKNIDSKAKDEIINEFNELCKYLESDEFDDDKKLLLEDL